MPSITTEGKKGVLEGAALKPLASIKDCFLEGAGIYGAGRGGDAITVEEGESKIDVIPVVEGGFLCATQLHEMEHSGWLIL
ncbi:hypothetical protein TNCV_1922731 [Trichonephila clavipes]|nr:hypothetical protein TNCV_1922731 [Trichonephila clavipes]